MKKAEREKQKAEDFIAKALAKAKDECYCTCHSEYASISQCEHCT